MKLELLKFVLFVTILFISGYIMMKILTGRKKLFLFAKIV